MSDDASLIARAAAGERAAFDAFVERHQAAVFRFTRGIAADAAAAEDALQETFLAAWRSASTFRGSGSARPWLFAIARNAVMRQYRKRVDEPDDLEPLSQLGDEAGWGSADDPEREAIESERREILRRAMATLAVADREILLLRDVEGLSGDEASTVLGITLATMKTRLHRARLRLIATVRNEYARA